MAALDKGDIPVIREAFHGMPLGRSKNTAGLALERVMNLPDRKAVAGAILGAKYKEYTDENRNKTRDYRTVADIIYSTHSHVVRLQATVEGLMAAVTALATTLASDQPLDVDALVAAVGAKVDAAVGDLRDEPIELVVDDPEG
jgi:hypothetical protein